MTVNGLYYADVPLRNYSLTGVVDVFTRNYRHA